MEGVPIIVVSNDETDQKPPCVDDSLQSTDSGSTTSITRKLVRLSYPENRNPIAMTRITELRRKAQEATRYHKVFTIRGCFYSVRKALVHRGWVEKLDVHRRPTTTVLVPPITPPVQPVDDIMQLLPERRPGESRRQHILKCERNIMSRLLEYTPIDFLWTTRKEKSDWSDMTKNPGLLVNRFHKVPFSSKDGLCSSLRDFHWHFEDGVAESNYPRCFNVWKPDELTEFIDNFRMTACIGLLKWLDAAVAERGPEKVICSDGTVPLGCVNFALQRCAEYLDVCNHEDIDISDEASEALKIWDHDWDVFLTHHYLLTRENAQLASGNVDELVQLVGQARIMQSKIREFWPQFTIDGWCNVWIVKPGNKCRGRGIILMDNIKKILSLVNPGIITKSRYVVQKYIERPLIIYNTKFDIRQWFMVTSVQPLIVWMYRESYLRFSSKEFSLHNFHESVHLTNHAIQKRYQNGVRDQRLPSENMWDCHTYQAYLRQIGQAHIWNERIFPGMQRAIIGAMLAGQDNMDRRTNTFELFGADFMICEEFYPWLIEINASPDLGSTTSVTARLCPSCLDDAVKVTVDRRSNPRADTGGFEMIYKQIIPPAPAYMGLNLCLKGRQLLPKSSGAKKDKHKSDSPLVRNLASISPSKPTTIRTAFPMRPFHQRLSHSDSAAMNFIENLGEMTAEQIEVALNGSSTEKNRLQVPFLRKSLQSLHSPTHSLSSIPSDSGHHQPAPKKSVSRHCERDLKSVAGEKLAKNVSFIRRQVSCGPRLLHIVEKLSELDASATEKTRKELSCVGNRYRLESPLPEPLIKLDKDSNKRQIDEKKKTIRKRLHTSGNTNLISTAMRPSQKHPSNIPLTKSAKELSHFFAMGLSLRAWRAKYNRLLVTHKENSASPLPMPVHFLPSRQKLQHHSKRIPKHQQQQQQQQQQQDMLVLPPSVKSIVSARKTEQPFF